MFDETVYSEKTLEAKGRSRMYRLFGAIYAREVDSELLAILGSEEVSAALSGLGGDFRDLLKEASDGEKSLLEELTEEYSALFVLPGGVSPYESVRLKGLLCQEPEWKAREFYGRCGLALKEGAGIFADHLGMELDFMGYLAEKESEAWKGSDEESARRWHAIQLEFFDKHPGKWVFGFLDDLEKYAKHPFYKRAAVITRSFLNMENEGLHAGEKPAGRRSLG